MTSSGIELEAELLSSGRELVEAMVGSSGKELGADSSGERDASGEVVAVIVSVDSDRGASDNGASDTGISPSATGLDLQANVRSKEVVVR